MAFTTALSTFFSLLSIFCSAAALALPVIALVRRKNALSFAAVSMGLCAFSLLGQIFEYNIIAAPIFPQADVCFR